MCECGQFGLCQVFEKWQAFGIFFVFPGVGSREFRLPFRWGGMCLLFLTLILSWKLLKFCTSEVCFELSKTGKSTFKVRSHIGRWLLV